MQVSVRLDCPCKALAWPWSSFIKMSRTIKLSDMDQSSLMGEELHAELYLRQCCHLTDYPTLFPVGNNNLWASVGHPMTLNGHTGPLVAINDFGKPLTAHHFLGATICRHKVVFSHRKKGLIIRQMATVSQGRRVRILNKLIQNLRYE